MGRKDKAVEIPMIEGVMSRSAATDIGSIVVPNEITRIVEIEFLFQAVHMDAGWEGHFEYSPAFIVLFMLS